MNQTIRLEAIPRRIVSLVPSQTELLYDLGLDENVVGITKFCIHPKEWFQTKVRIGGTKSVDIEKVKALQPDLIIGNKEENTKEDIEAMKEIAPVYMSDIFNLEDALEMMKDVGELTGKSVEVEILVHQVRASFSHLRPLTRPLEVVYFIWKDPYYVCGKSTFVDDMLVRCGLNNVVIEDRYPEWSLKKYPASIYLFSSEPYPFKQKHLEEFEDSKGQKILVDGEYFSWYGSRLKDAPIYFQQLIDSIEASV